MDGMPPCGGVCCGFGRAAKHAAPALVPPGKQVGAGELWLGNPARRVRALGERELEQLAYSATHYVRLKDRYRAAQQQTANTSAP